MASASNNPSFIIPNITSLVSIKLEGPNYLNWTTQFIPVLRSHDLVSIVDGSEVCPPQYLIDSDGKVTSDINPAYLADQLSAAGKPIENDDLISYVVGGLNPIFTPFITTLNVATHDHSISFDDFQTELLNFEQLLEAQNQNLPSAGRHPPTWPHMAAHLSVRAADHVTVGNGGGLNITTTGSCFLSNSKTKFFLSDILHCPNASSNLLSIQKFCHDNNYYFLLTTTHFLVKDMQTRETLLQGPSKGGHYPIYLQQLKLNKSTPKAALVSSFTALLGVTTPLQV
ncbi:hypothetical protein Pint_05982 [Pistacia integerrima]|uniref:Uncharacterized protein n=1 Tax=Pistacia integerrima TaxID=434235 RepID=A0ACC0Z5C0_9ROSI|nr:hypothetical protein Pint_05982 [Pistacia integerrima]